jgi:hypothetical protein
MILIYRYSISFEKWNIFLTQYGASLQLVPKTKEVCNFVY